MSVQNTTSYADNNERLISALYAIDPATLQYNEWLNVGMALHAEGLDISVWDSWSQRDPARYRGLHDLENHWRSFTPGKGIAGGTIVHMAKETGWTQPEYEHIYVPMSQTEARNILAEQLYNACPHDIQQAKPVIYKLQNLDMSKQLENAMPEDMTPIDQAAMYLHMMFKPGEYVCLPSSPADSTPITKTFEELFNTLQDKNVTTEGFNKILGEEGRYIVINPTNGQGRKDENATAFRHVLLESDDIPTDKQQQLMLALNLPITAIVDSGNKSIHAAVRIDAKDREEYDRRVRFLYDVCKANGLPPDNACKNPARMTRFPGCMRTVHKWDGTKPKSYLTPPGFQRLIALQNGAGSWDEWEQWYNQQAKEQPVEESPTIPEPVQPQELPQPQQQPQAVPPVPPQPVLPEPYTLKSLFNSTFTKPKTLIKGLLSCGDVMVFTAPPKSGKSINLTQLSLNAICGGWYLQTFKFTEPCKIIYFGLESTEYEIYDRIKRQCKELNIKQEDIINSDSYFFPLFGTGANIHTISCLVEKYLTDDSKPTIVIIDPLYMLIKNELDTVEVLYVMTTFQRIAASGNCAVIIAHHERKYGSGDASPLEAGSGSAIISRNCTAALQLREISQTNTAAGEYVQARPRETPDGDQYFMTPYRLKISPGRHHPKLQPIDLLFDYPLFIPAPEGLFAADPEDDSTEGRQKKRAAAGGQATKDRSEMIRAQYMRLIKEAARQCDIGNEPTTKENIYKYFAEYCERDGAEVVAETTFSKWARPSEDKYPFCFAKDTKTIIFDDARPTAQPAAEPDPAQPEQAAEADPTPTEDATGAAGEPVEVDPATFAA